MYKKDIKNDLIITPNEEAFEIDLKNRLTGTTYPEIPVYGRNTLGQLLLEYGSDIGVNANDCKIIFQNSRTGLSTCDKNETISGIGLLAGDKLEIADNAGVA